MKTLSGALIPYGSTLPSDISSADGALFYKTDSAGSPQGLYLYGFIADSQPGTIGNQVAQGWVQAIAPDLFVLKGGDTMTGALTVPGFLRVTQTTGAQRFLIGNQDAGGANKPSIIQAQNGVLAIGTGSTWLGSGGTFLSGLSIDASSASGLTFQGGQVWHAGNDGAASGLDADLLDGQQGSFYQNAANISTGVLATLRGGTGASLSPAAGSIVYASSTTTMAAVAGTAGQVLVSAGAAAPVWTNQASLSVGNATFATSAGSATTAGFATNAGTAANVAWTGITGFPAAVQTFPGVPAASFTTYARPSLFYDFGNTGVASMAPGQFQIASISGFDSYATSDIGSFQVGLTVIGTAGLGARSLQLAASWDREEAAPFGLRFRVNDDSSDVSAWGAFRTIWDQGNLSNVSQLTNDAGYATSAALANYVLKAGDTMTGGLTTTALAVNAALGGVGSITAGSTISATGNVTSTGGSVLATTGQVTAGVSGVTGQVGLHNGGGANTGYVEFYSQAGVRQGYIGFGATTNLAYYLENGLTNHQFTGSITSTGNVTAYASDGRLKKNITPIENAAQKVVALGGYSYDWDMIKCDELGFKPEREHEHGLIAQDVQKVLPDAVAPAPFDNRYLTVRYDRVVALLTAAIGEQQKQIEMLMAKVAELEAK